MFVSRLHFLLVSFVVLVLSLSLSHTSALVRVEISTDAATSVVLGEMLTLDITAYLSGDSRPTGELLMEDLAGMEAFEIVSSSQSFQSVQTFIDGERVIEQATVFRFGLLASVEGTHTLGPITVDTTDGPITSNTLVIEVGNKPNDVSGMDFWIGVIVAVAAVCTIIAAIVRAMSSKKIQPLSTYSKEEMYDRIQSGDSVDDLFFLLQDILAHEYGDVVRTYTHEEIQGLADDPLLHELLRIFRDHRYTPSEQTTLGALKDAFTSYIESHDT